MDDNLFGDHHTDVGSPVVPTNPETYVMNPDGTITGTVTAEVTIGLALSEPLANDVVVYLRGNIPQDGQDCSGEECVFADYPCVLPAGETSTACDIPNWWQSYSSTLALGTGTDYNLIYTDPGQANLVTDQGHPYAYGEGFSIITAFIPWAPVQSLQADMSQSESPSFLVQYRPVFAGNFTLNVKRGTKVIARRFLGWKKAGAYSVRFWCGTRTGKLTFLVVGTTHGHVQRSNTRSVSC